MKTVFHAAIITSVSLLAAKPLLIPAQGLPPEVRSNIHTLFNNHDKITRKVTTTDKGYVATTESDDPKVAAALQEHVEQMSSRLESGLMLRRWDPAFAEYVAHYKDIEHKFEKTEKGLRMTVTGRNDIAIKVVQNHAAVVSEFVKDGWAAHDRSHAPAVKTETATTASKACCDKNAAGSCCQVKRRGQK